MATQRTIAPKKLARNFADGGIVGLDGLTDRQRAILGVTRNNLGISNAPQPQAQIQAPVQPPTPPPKP